MAGFSASDWQKLMTWLDAHPQPATEAPAWREEVAEQPTGLGKDAALHEEENHATFQGAPQTSTISTTQGFPPPHHNDPKIPSASSFEPLSSAVRGPQHSGTGCPIFEHLRVAEGADTKVARRDDEPAKFNEYDMTTGYEKELPYEKEGGQLDEEELLDAGLQWSNQLNTVQEARNFLTSLSGEMQIPDVENDDAQDIRENAMIRLGNAVLQALLYRPTPPPIDLSKTQKEYYQKQQEKTMTKIQDSLSTRLGQKTAEGRILLLLDEAINCHTVGLPATDFKAKAALKTGYKSLTNLTCGERIAKIISCIQQNKMIALDVLIGSGFQHLARNPDHFLERKLINLKSNANKRGNKDVLQDSQWGGLTQLEDKDGRDWSVKMSGLAPATGRKRGAREVDGNGVEAAIDERRTRPRHEMEPASNDHDLAFMGHDEPYFNQSEFDAAFQGGPLDEGQIHAWPPSGGDSY